MLYIVRIIFQLSANQEKSLSLGFVMIFVDVASKTRNVFKGDANKWTQNVSAC